MKIKLTFSSLPLPCHTPCPAHSRVPSGEILEAVVADNNLTEAIAVGYLSQLLSAADTLHRLKIAHLDIRVSHMTVT